jgi:hypothetical protein
MKGTIKILDLKKFVAPLKALSSSINSIILTKVGDTFMVNAATADGSQMSNTVFTNKIIQITSGAETIEKLGIFDLGQFITALSLIETTTIEIKVDNNVLVIKYNDKSDLTYILTDLNLIKEGPAQLKKDPGFVATVEINNAFIKKVKSVSASIGANILRLTSKNGALSYTVGDRNNHSHKYSEVLIDNGIESDFEVLLSIKDDKRDNFGFLFDGCSYKLSIHPRLVQLVGVTSDYELLRYFISPLSE